MSAAFRSAISALPPPALAAAGAALLGAAAYGAWRAFRRPGPEELERRRRIRVHLKGRLVETTVYQAEPTVLHYGYEIAGVAYDTTQDISALGAHLPRPAEQLIGTALAKYDPQNPANSIVVCEYWQGFRERNPQA